MAPRLALLSADALAVSARSSTSSGGEPPEDER